MSFTARRKIQKEKGQEPDEFEESVAQALFDLESTNSELKSDLRDLFINSAKEVDVSGNRKAVIIHVPYRLRKAFQKIHARLVRELEKKFSGKGLALACETMNKPGNAGGPGGGGGNFGPGGVAGPTAAAAAQAAQRQRSLLQRADADIGSLLDNFSHLLKAARINDPVRNAQEAFQMEVHAARVVQAADSLLKLVSELKQSAVFSDFLSLNRSINQRIVKFGELSQETDKRLIDIGDEAAASLQELEAHYYASPYRTLESNFELLSNIDGA